MTYAVVVMGERSKDKGEMRECEERFEGRARERKEGRKEGRKEVKEDGERVRKREEGKVLEAQGKDRRRMRRVQSPAGKGERKGE